MRVAKTPNEGLALTNCVIVNPRDFHPNVRYITVEGQFVMTIRYVCDLSGLVVYDYKWSIGWQGSVGNDYDQAIVPDRPVLSLLLENR